MPQEPPKATPEVQALLGQARQALLAGKTASAAALYDQALARARELQDRKSEGDALRGQGLVAYSTGQPQQALERFHQAVEVYRAIGDPLGEAATLDAIGIVSFATGQTRQALESHQRALPLHRTVGNRAAEAGTLNSLGIVHSATGQPQQALEFYQQALEIFRALGDKRGEAGTLGNLGVAAYATGQPQKALEFYHRALPIYRETGNRPFEANALLNLGIVHRAIGQPRQALELYQQALEIYRTLGDKRGEAATRDGIGVVYRFTGQPRQALEAYQEALALYRAVGDRRGEAATLGNLGEVLASTGRLTRALGLYQQALPLHRALGNRTGEANLLVSLGSVSHSSGQRAKALGFYQRALPLYRDTEDRRGEALTLHNLGVVTREAGQPQRALGLLNQALSLYRKAGSAQGEAETLAHLAVTEEALGRPAPAEAHYARAIALSETLRANLGGFSEAKAAFLGSTLDVYYGYLNLLLARGKTADAFALAQKTKARSLLDLMASGRVDLGGELTPQERAQERELREKADALNQQMVKEGVQNEVGAKKRYAALQADLKQTESALQTLTDTLYARHPGLAQKRAARTATFADVARLLPPDTALLEYMVVSRKTLALFVVTRGKVEAVTLPVAYASLVGKASALRSACADPRREYRAEASELRRLLLAPAARHLTGAKRLIVCPDGVLWDVPFAALVDGRGRFLAEGHEIVYAYSATGAVASLTAKPGRKKPTGTLLALANPDFGSAQRFGDLDGVPGQRPIDSPSRPIDTPSRPIDTPSRPLDSPSRAFDAVSRGGAIVSLPGTQREADALRRLFPGSAVLTGKAAQEGKAKQAMGRHRWLHFATHGVFNDASPMLSSLVLAQPAPGSQDDGFLTAREIFEMDLSAEMAVLSACNTARGVQRTGDGIIGLTWALFVAGCPTQVVSQWAVDDASTATLMQRFYSNLAGKRMSKGAALRQASLALMNDPKRRHPYYWAPFVLMGDWR